MARISKYPISNNVYEKIVNIFLEAFTKLRSKKEVQNFFNEFLTPTEQIMLAKRLAISLFLAKGYNYREISSILKVSLSTINDISDKYKYGYSLNKIADSLVKSEIIEGFWLEIAKAFTSIGSIGSKGTEGWRYLDAEIKKKRNEVLF